MSTLLALCSRQPGNELIAAECENLTGSKPGLDGIAECQAIEYIPRAAYIRCGLRLIARAGNLASLTAEIRHCSFEAERFHISFLRLSEDKTLREADAVIAVANAIHAAPDLTAPRHRFLLIVREEELLFGEIAVEQDHSYRQHDSKPYWTSSSLPSQVSRALINLVAPPARTIYDPCCGTSSILLEALSVGLSAIGSDWNRRMVGMSRRNLAHFGYMARVSLTDAAETTQTADAIITDLPYGRVTMLDLDKLQAIFYQAVQLAPLAVYVAARPISDLLSAAGYREIEVFQVRKQKGFSRYVHRARAGS